METGKLTEFSSIFPFMFSFCRSPSSNLLAADIIEVFGLLLFFFLALMVLVGSTIELATFTLSDETCNHISTFSTLNLKNSALTNCRLQSSILTVCFIDMAGDVMRNLLYLLLLFVHRKQLF